MKIALLCLVLIAAATADKIPDFVVRGNCPNVDERSLFDRQRPNYPRYAGVWYEIALTKNPYQLIKKCVRNDYSYDGGKFSVTSSGSDSFDSQMTRTGQVLPMVKGDPHLSVDFEGSFIAPYVILDTDYENFACVYSCTEYNSGYYSDFAFIYARSPSLQDQYYRRCESAFRNIGVDGSRFTRTIQGPSCSYSSHTFF